MSPLGGFLRHVQLGKRPLQRDYMSSLAWEHLRMPPVSPVADAVLVNSPPDSCPVYLIVRKVVVEMDVVVLQLGRNVGFERNEDEAFPRATTPVGTFG